jgi:hypothetical protein
MMAWTSAARIARSLLPISELALELETLTAADARILCAELLRINIQTGRLSF